MRACDYAKLVTAHGKLDYFPAVVFIGEQCNHSENALL